MEVQHLGNPGGRPGGIDAHRLVPGAGVLPDAIEPPCVEVDWRGRTQHQTRAQSFKIGAQVIPEQVDIEIARTGCALGWPKKIRGAAKQIGILSADHPRSEARGSESGDGAVVAIGRRTQSLVYLVDQFGYV